MEKILFDTSFLIRLMNKTEPLHDTAVECFKYCLNKKILPITSAICISEYTVKANPDNIPSEIKVLPFTHATAYITGNINKGHDTAIKEIQLKTTTKS